MQSRSYHLVGLGAGLPQIKINIPADCGLEMTAANVVIFVFQSAVAPQDSYLRSFLLSPINIRRNVLKTENAALTGRPARTYSELSEHGHY